MAESKQPLVVCAPLCFMCSKRNKLVLGRIKAVLCDFYTVDDISDAKRRLLKDAESIMVDKLPTCNRRDSDGRLHMVKEVDDILSVIITLDEKKIVNGAASLRCRQH